MKTQMGVLCFAVLTLLAEAQIAAQLPAQILSNVRFPLDNYRPLLDLLDIESDNSENEDLSIVSAKFPAEEVDCSNNTSTQGEECPLKENGKRMDCSVKLSHTSKDGDIQGFEMSCEASIEVVVSKRVRRSRGSSRGGGRNSGGSRGSRGGGGARGSGASKGSRSGRGSSIAGRGNRNNGGTRTA